MMLHNLRARILDFRITPDGGEYIRMSNGEQVANPYNLRFVLPLVCRDSRVRWLVASWGSTIVSTVCVAVLATQHGLTLQQSAVAALLWLGLPSVRFLVKAPVLVDGPGMAFALLAAVVFPLEPIAAMVLIAIGAGISEKAPIWAALFAWNPILLAGLAVPLIRWLGWKAGPIREGAVEKAHLEFHQHSGGLQSRVSVFRHAQSVVYPWGAALFALTVPDIWWMAAVAVAMGQMIVAWDTVRLIQMSAPAVCVAAAAAIPDAWALPALVAHWTNPLAGNGL